MFHESLTTTTDMAVLPCVLGRRSLRRTIQVRLGTTALRLPGGTAIFFALASLRSGPQAGSQLRGFVTAIHETSGLLWNTICMFCPWVMRTCRFFELIRQKFL